MLSNCSTNSERNTSGTQGITSRAPGREEAAPKCSPLSTAHIRPRIEYYAGASLLKSTKGIPCEAVGGGKRGKVKGFSHASRLRMMRTIGSIRRDAELPSFVTLTYPDEFPTVERAKRDLKVFIQRLRRKFPKAGFIWKLEPQQRGAPHYHMLVWGCSDVDLLAWVVPTWYDVAGNGDQNHFRFHAGLIPGTKPCVERVRSWRGVWSYASKYLGKTFDVAEWGNQWTGRFWGVGNREGIPFGEKIELDLTTGQVVRCMRYQRRFIRSHRGRRSVNSMTIFCDAQQWIFKLLSEYTQAAPFPISETTGGHV